MKGALRVAGLAGLAVLSACAARPPAPIVDAGPPPGINGRYRGTVRLVSAQDRSCPRSGPRVLDLVDGTVTVSYSGRSAARNRVPPRVPLSAVVQSSGAFQTSDGVGTLQGELRDGTLEFTISSPVCEHRWTLRQVS